MGDAGAIVTNSHDLAERMAMFARHGGLKKGNHQIEGINSRLDGIQAAVLSVKLRHLEEWTRVRREKAAIYSTRLAQIAGLEIPKETKNHEHVFHLYVVRHDRRDEIAAQLGAADIQTVVNYPVALPFLPAYRRLNHVPRDFPNAWSNQSRILSLPLFPEITDAQQTKVVEAVQRFGD